MVDFFDTKGKIYNGKNKWFDFFQPLEKQAIEYDKALKIFDNSLELKTYKDTKRIMPYQLKDGFKFVSAENGKVVSIIDANTKQIIIIKVLSDDEMAALILKRKRRKRKEFVDKALANSNIWTHWCTLTFSPELAPKAAYSYLKAKKAFMQWRKSIVRKFKYAVKYMAIAEYGEKNGRIHWHLLLSFDKSIAFEQARSQKGKLLYLMNHNKRNVLDDNRKSIPKLVIPDWQYGIADFYSIYNSPQKAIHYMAKYMTKGDNLAPYEEQGAKAKSFLSSKNLNKPKKEYFLDDTPSKLLSLENQKKLENATPTFKLINSKEEVMRKTEAIVDNLGVFHTVKIKTGIINIAKKHQPKLPTETADDI